MASAAMAVLVFEGEKMASVGFICVREWPLRAVRRSLGHLRGLLRTFFKPSSIQSSDERIEVSQFSVYIAILEREARRKLGREGLTCAHAWRLFLAVRFNRFSSYRNYRWDDSSSIWPKHGLRSDLRVPNLKNFLGEHPPDPPSLFTPQWPYQFSWLRPWGVRLNEWLAGPSLSFRPGGPSERFVRQ